MYLSNANHGLVNSSRASRNGLIPVENPFCGKYAFKINGKISLLEETIKHDKKKLTSLERKLIPLKNLHLKPLKSANYISNSFKNPADSLNMSHRAFDHFINYLECSRKILDDKNRFENSPKQLTSANIEYFKENSNTKACQVSGKPSISKTIRSIKRFNSKYYTDHYIHNYDNSENSEEIKANNVTTPLHIQVKPISKLKNYNSFANKKLNTNTAGKSFAIKKIKVKIPSPKEGNYDSCIPKIDFPIFF